MSLPDAAQQQRLSHIQNYGPLERIFTSDKRQPWKYMTSDGMTVHPADFHKMLIQGKISQVHNCDKIMCMPRFYSVVPK